MKRSDVSFSFALCASLVLHASLCVTLAEMYVRGTGGRIWLPGVGRSALAEADAMPLLIDPRDDPRQRLGEPGGSGYAIDASPGERQLLARQGLQDQPLLSRDPVGHGRIGDEPTEWSQPPGTAERLAENLPTPAFASSGDAQPVGIPLPAAPPPPRVPPPLPPPPAQPLEAAQPAAVEPTNVPHATQDEPPPAPPLRKPAAASPAAGAARLAARPGPPTSADPAPKGQSEIDPVSIVGTMDFRTGSTTVRAGRKHRITRPRLTLDAKADLVTLGSTYLILKIHLDGGGHVTSAHVVRSSGSQSLDQIFKVTSYEWWFEPARGAAGGPEPDVFPFVIRIN